MRKVSTFKIFVLEQARMKFVFVDYMNVPKYDCDTPYTLGIGGTQSAICYYAEELVKGGNDVTVVSLNATENTTVRGVQFRTIQWMHEDPGKEIDVLIWTSGVLAHKIIESRTLFKTTITICWIPHNVSESTVSDLEKVMYYIDFFAFVSNWQRTKFVEMFNIPPGKTVLMLNGISPSFIGDFVIENKKPIFLYLSEPNRGLNIVADAWQSIVDAYPEAELHAYSSRKLYGEKDLEKSQSVFEKLKSMPSVKLLDPIGQTELATKCREASFFAYPAKVSETGCIVVTEACASGCIPIVSNLGALSIYFDDCLEFNDTITDSFTERCKQELYKFYNDKLSFYKKSEQLASYFQNTRNYARIVQQFVLQLPDMLKRKKYTINAMNKALTAFNANEWANSMHIYESCDHLYDNPTQAHTCLNNVGVCHYYLNHYNVAIKYFKRAWDISKNSQLAINMILCYEKLNDADNVLYWCEKSLEFSFNMNVVHKVLDIILTKSLFERTKWSHYIEMLWNNDIQSPQWSTLKMSHGNVMASDYHLIMKQEKGTEATIDIIQKIIAFMHLNKIDIKQETEPRSNVEKMFSNMLLNINYHETKNPETYKYFKFYNDTIPQLESIKSYTFNKIPKGRKLRIGFVTGDLCYHPVSYVMNGIVEHINKDKFDIFVISDGKRLEDNIMQKRVREHATEYIETKDKSLNEMCELIASKDIDVLVEMTGHTTNGARFPNMLRTKPARVVANYFAFPNTYGIKEIDYKIGDKHVFPVGIDKYYFEGLWKMPNGFHTYKPIMPVDLNRVKHEGIVFGCTNNPKKYRPVWIKCVAKILNAVPNSRIKMRYYNLDDISVREFYHKEFEKHGVDRSRVDLDLGSGLHNYFASYNDMDIVLDPFPYNGGTINIETLYMGVPYITMLGNSYVSRVGASILNQVGATELIAKTEDDYVKKAVELAADTERLANYHATLREKMLTSNLGDSAKFAAEFEDAMVGMLKEKKWLS